MNRMRMLLKSGIVLAAVSLFAFSTRPVPAMATISIASMMGPQTMAFEDFGISWAGFAGAVVGGAAGGAAAGAVAGAIGTPVGEGAGVTTGAVAGAVGGAVAYLVDAAVTYILSGTGASDQLSAYAVD